jgi:hypothetical protein
MKKRQLVRLFLILIVSPQVLFAEITVRPFVSTGTLELNMTANVPQREGFLAPIDDIRPNVTQAKGVSIGLNLLTFSLAQNEEPDATSLREKGQSQYEDYQVHLYASHIGIDLFSQRFKGFYHEQEKYVDSGLHAQNPNMSMKKVGANIYYVFNPTSFSVDAAFHQSRQVKGEGFSWVAMLSGNEVVVTNGGEPILTEYMQGEFGENGAISGFEMTSLGLQVGCGIVKTYFSNFYLAGQILVGGAAQQFKGTGIADTSSQAVTAIMSNVRAVIGYSGKTYFWGGKAVVDKVTTEVSNYEITPTSTIIEGYVGARF